MLSKNLIKNYVKVNKLTCVPVTKCLAGQTNQVPEGSKETSELKRMELLHLQHYAQWLLEKCTIDSRIRKS